MFDGVWDFLKKKEDLLDAATVDCLMMLATGKEMFRIVTQALEQEVDVKVREQVATMDKQVNKDQIKVRKKVLEHLAVSRRVGLVRSLQLTTMVIDLERIGDYGKNMAELVDVLPAKLSFGAYQERFDQVQAKTLELFDMTRDAIRDDNENVARKVIAQYDTISKTCDGTVIELFESLSNGDTVNKSILGLALLLRYMKRTAAHLKNISTSVSNPYHRIGRRPKPGP